MEINTLKTKNNFHNYVSIKQIDNTSPIELLLCGSEGSQLTNLNTTCTVTLLDTVDNQIRQKSTETIVGGLLKFKVKNALKANNHNLEVTLSDGSKYPSDGDFTILVSKSHTDRELEIINTMTYDDAVKKLAESVVTDFVEEKFYKMSSEEQDMVEVIEARDGNASLGERLDNMDDTTLKALIESTKANMQPKFVEFFGSFSRYGIGVPSGVSNYTGGNYVLSVTGNAGDTFVTVTSGNISHAGGIWACVIQKDDGRFELNKVISNDGVSKLNLLEPLKSTITNGKLGNLQDSSNGQHYTELGYYAFAQHIYYANTRYVERNKIIGQSQPTDTTLGKWVTNGVVTYNMGANVIEQTYKTLGAIGSKSLGIYMTDTNKYAEWEGSVADMKGYVEVFLSTSTGSAKVEYFEDDVVKSSETVTTTVNKFIFPFQSVKKAKIRITAVSGMPFNLKIGRTTWFLNERYQDDRLINPSDKVVYIGDSWGEFHNKATTRELERLMKADGGSPIIWNFSRGGHTSYYAREGFKKYVIDNKPDKVIIEYFTNDFNSINGTVLQPFNATDGTQKDMNIKDLSEYQANMQWMIDESIKNGIQPIIIMPAATNAEGQILTFGDNANKVWNGQLTTVTDMYLKKLLVDSLISNGVTSKDSTKVGEGVLSLISKEMNSAIRKGVISDSGTGSNLTGGDVHGFYNNGVRKAGINYEGVIDMLRAKLFVNQYSLAKAEAQRGTLYILNGTASSNNDEFRAIVKRADGTYKEVKFLTQDV